jgi:hypothetical protein|tara:strand:- start:85 stop:354 length:270 start_codon:yes stop_codon:yes gene_type:complete
MKDIIPQPIPMPPIDKVGEIPPERENLAYSTYLEMFKAEFPGIAEHLLDSNDKIVRSAAVDAPENLTDEELLCDIIHEILEIPPKDLLS